MHPPFIKEGWGGFAFPQAPSVKTLYMKLLNKKTPPKKGSVYPNS